MPAAPRLLTAVSAAAILTTGATAASASAAAIAVPVGCVVTTVSSSDLVLPIIGSGFTPGSFVSFSTVTTSKPTPSFLTSVQADAAGNILVGASRASFNSFKTLDQTFSLIASVGGSPVAATTFRQVRGGYTQPSGGSPHRKARYSARGFVPGKNVYVHFRRGSRTVKTVKLGKANSPCGLVSRKFRQLPVARPHVGTYRIYVDQARRYSSHTQLQARGELRIVTVFR